MYSQTHLRALVETFEATRAKVGDAERALDRATADCREARREALCAKSRLIEAVSDGGGRVLIGTVLYEAVRANPFSPIDLTVHYPRIVPSDEVKP